MNSIWISSAELKSIISLRIHSTPQPNGHLNMSCNACALSVELIELSSRLKQLIACRKAAMNCYEFLVDDPAYVCVIIYNCPHKIKKKHAFIIVGLQLRDSWCSYYACIKLKLVI